jgi:hypothetical protein
MSVINVAGHGAAAKIQIEGTYPDDNFEGKMLFEIRDGKLRIEVTRQRPGGRSYTTPGVVDIEQFEHIYAVLKGEEKL